MRFPKTRFLQIVWSGSATTQEAIGSGTGRAFLWRKRKTEDRVSASGPRDQILTRSCRRTWRASSARQPTSHAGSSTEQIKRWIWIKTKIPNGLVKHFLDEVTRYLNVSKGQNNTEICWRHNSNVWMGNYNCYLTNFKGQEKLFLLSCQNIRVIFCKPDVTG